MVLISYDDRLKIPHLKVVSSQLVGSLYCLLAFEHKIHLADLLFISNHFSVSFINYIIDFF
jgi:hypothetical protein